MATLAGFLARDEDLPVLDMTGLKGYYQVSLSLSLADLIANAKAQGFAGEGTLPPIET